MKRLSFLPFTLLVLFLGFGSAVSAQITTPRPSPFSSVTQKVGLTDVTISYYRPSAKGRKVYGDVVPFDKIWRTGANDPTTISFSDTVAIGGAKIPGGTYALYTIPGASEWTIILGKNPKAQAGSHKQEDDIVRFKVKSERLNDKVETFTIDFADVTTNSANIMLSWENTAVKFRVETDYDRKVMAQIKESLGNTYPYYQAASYYYETNRDMKQALEWINIDTDKNPKFYSLHLKAKIQVRLNDCKGAVETAKKSMELAKTAGNDEYIKMNEKLIADCKKK